MTAEEIRREYRLAKNPAMQIQILADENGVSRKIIEDIIFGKRDKLPEAKEVKSTKKLPEKKAAKSPKYCHWSSDELAAIEEMYKNGEKIPYIAKKMKRSYSSVRKKIYELADTGTVTRRNFHATIKMRYEASKLWKDGYSAGEISRVLDIPQTTIYGMARCHRDLFPKKKI